MNGVDEDLQGWSMDSVAVAGGCRKRSECQDFALGISATSIHPIAAAFDLDDGNFSIGTRNTAVEEQSKASLERGNCIKFETVRDHAIVSVFLHVLSQRHAG